MKKILREIESGNISRKKERKKERKKQRNTQQLEKKEEICKTPRFLKSYFSYEKIIVMYEISQETEEV